MVSPVVVCDIFRCSRRAEMYLYVDRARGTDDLPEALLSSLGELTPAMTLTLTHERHLARADVVKVMAAIAQQGYYLQMPPAEWQPDMAAVSGSSDA